MTDKPRRHQTATERDLAGIGAKKLRESGNWVTEHITDEITGRYEGDELQEHRAQRRPPERMAHVEQRLDGVVNTISEWRAEVSKEISAVTAAVGGLAGEVKGLAKVVENTASQNHVTFTARVDVDKAQAIDVIDEKKTKRDVRAKIVGGVLGGGFIAQVLHQLGIL